MTRNDRSSTVASSANQSDGILAHQYRMQCEECDRVQIANLGGEKQAAADAGEPVTLRCGYCKRDTAHHDVTGGSNE